MSQSPSPPPPSADDLQFDVVETSPIPVVASVAPQRMSCVACRGPIASMYYAVAGKVVCPQCAQQIGAGPAGSAAGRIARATLFGLGAGLLGTLIWFAVRRMMNVEIGLIAILVGYMVGKAVRKGSANVGGPGYQVLAVVLTYGCIALNYVPDVMQIMQASGATDRGQTVSTYADAYGRALRWPFLGGMSNVIRLLIVGFALFEAWKLTARRRIPLTGPYQVGARVATVPGVRT